jgi:hypothetical protein
MNGGQHICDAGKWKSRPQCPQSQRVPPTVRTTLSGLSASDEFWRNGSRGSVEQSCWTLLSALQPSQTGCLAKMQQHWRLVPCQERERDARTLVLSVYRARALNCCVHD